jgi:hypothetical protein
MRVLNEETIMVRSEVRPGPVAPEVSAPPRRIAVAVALVIALVYLLIYAGVLSIGAAEAGELGVLGVAGLVFAGIALLLWRTSSRAVWVGVVGLQLVMGAMYVAVAPDRDPAFEVWGLLIRVLSLILVVAVVWLAAVSWRRRDSRT